MPDLKHLTPDWNMDTQAGGVVDVAYNPKHSLFAIATAEGPVVVINTTTKSNTILSGHENGCASVCWSPEGDVLVTIGQDGRLRWWDAKSFKQIMDVPSGGAWGVKVVFSPDGKYLASAASKRLTVWDSKGKVVCEYPDHSSTIADIAWHPELEQIISCCYGVINFWGINAQSPKCVFSWKGSILVLSLSLDGKWIATGNQNASVHFWDIKSGKNLMMSGYQTKVREMSWSTNSRYLATGGDNAVVVWDCSGRGPRGSKPLILGGPEEFITTVLFAEEANVLAAGSKDGFIFIWDVSNVHYPLAVYKEDGCVEALAWKQNGDLVAVYEGGKFIVFARPVQ